MSRLKIHIIPTQYVDRSGKTRKISSKFSWSPTRYHADRHPLSLAIHRSSGMISGELNDHAFGARLLGFGDPDNLSPIDYKSGSWRRSKDKRIVYFDGGGQRGLAL